MNKRVGLLLQQFVGWLTQRTVHAARAASV